MISIFIQRNLVDYSDLSEYASNLPRQYGFDAMGPYKTRGFNCKANQNYNRKPKVFMKPNVFNYNVLIVSYIHLFSRHFTPNTTCKIACVQIQNRTTKLTTLLKLNTVILPELLVVSTRNWTNFLLCIGINDLSTYFDKM